MCTLFESISSLHLVCQTELNQIKKPKKKLKKRILIFKIEIVSLNKIMKVFFVFSFDIFVITEANR